MYFVFTLSAQCLTEGCEVVSKLMFVSSRFIDVRLGPLGGGEDDVIAGIWSLLSCWILKHIAASGRLTLPVAPWSQFARPHRGSAAQSGRGARSTKRGLHRPRLFLRSCAWP